MHQSRLEATRCTELTLMEAAGEISELKQQPRFRLEVNGVHICDYIADWSYVTKGAQAEVVEDAKGVLTAECRLKLKLMQACRGIEVQLIRKGRRR
jgi:hypothetical protein